jgi:aspartyl-tRNA(Asn)/glutamyl-tRNA(Gln) amidotransferase subunit A
MTGSALAIAPSWRQGDGITEMYEKTRAEGLWGQRLKRRVMVGTYVLSRPGFYDAYYNRARKVRALIKKDFDDVFRRRVWMRS